MDYLNLRHGFPANDYVAITWERENHAQSVDHLAHNRSRYADRPGQRKAVHSLLRKLFNWAVDREDIEVSPLAGMKAPKAVASRRRVLGHEELVCLWKACEHDGPGVW